jgi:hypothetical protein
MRPRDRDRFQGLRCFSPNPNNYNNLGNLLFARQSTHAASSVVIRAQFCHRLRSAPQNGITPLSPSGNLTVGDPASTHRIRTTAPEAAPQQARGPNHDDSLHGFCLPHPATAKHEAWVLFYLPVFVVQCLVSGLVKETVNGTAHGPKPPIFVFARSAGDRCLGMPGPSSANQFNPTQSGYDSEDVDGIAAGRGQSLAGCTPSTVNSDRARSAISTRG